MAPTLLSAGGSAALRRAPSRHELVGSPETPGHGELHLAQGYLVGRPVPVSQEVMVGRS